jgi:hypothetical protein
MACDPNALLYDARLFSSLTEEQRAVIILWLWCQIAAGSTPPADGNFRITEEGDFRITETGDSRIVE